VVARGAGVGLAVVAATLAGATLADARLAAVDGGPLPALEGRTLQARAVVLEPVRLRAGGRRAVRLRVIDGPASGAQALARVGGDLRWPGRTGWGRW
jgi:hypothetical protein